LNFTVVAVAAEQSACVEPKAQSSHTPINTSHWAEESVWEREWERLEYSWV